MRANQIEIRPSDNEAAWYMVSVNIATTSIADDDVLVFEVGKKIRPLSDFPNRMSPQGARELAECLVLMADLSETNVTIGE